MAQADQTIANNTGANVRADINSNLAALYSQNSGTTEPTVKTAHMTWVDESTTPNTLKIRNASNNGWISVGQVATDFGHMAATGGSFSGNISLPSGTAGSPSLQINDVDSGFYLYAANQIGTSTGGTLRTITNSSGFLIRDGLGLKFSDSGNSNTIELKAPALTSDVTLTLPNSDGNNGDMLQTDGSGVLTWQAVQGVPSGSVFCHASTTLPSGYLECNGAAVSRSTYAALFSAISTTWGSGDGSSTFNVPDLRGEFVRGFDNGRGVDSGRSFADPQGSQYGQHNHSGSSISVSLNDPGHTHRVRVGTAGGGGGGNVSDRDSESPGNYVSNQIENQTTGITVSSSISVANAGGTNNSSETRPRNISMMYIIKI